MKKQRALAVVSILSSCLLASPRVVVGQELDELPVSDLPLCDPPPQVQFLAVVRERGLQPKEDWSDMRITLWEIRPERVEEPAVRRRVLGRSDWAPDPLLDSSKVLRWQVNGTRPRGGNGYFVKILGVDYATFEVSEWLTVGQAFAIGCSGDRYYLDTSEGQRILDAKTGELHPQTPAIELLVSRGDDWLVEVDRHAARFDAATGEVVKRYSGIELGADRDERRHVEWDGGRVAVESGRYFDEQGEAVWALDYGKTSIVYAELNVWDLDAGTQRRLLVRTQGTGGSGVGVIPIDVRVEVEGDRLRYAERFPASGEHAELEDASYTRDYQWVTIDLATGEELGREPVTKVPKEERELTRPIPDYLREGFDASPIRAWGEDQDLAWAFLEGRGVAPDLPETGVCKFRAVCRTPDGSELLVLHQGTFYHCDLEQRTLRRWSAPVALEKGSVELYAVEP